MQMVQAPIHISDKIYMEIAQEILDSNGGDSLFSGEILIEVGRFTGSLEADILFSWQKSPDPWDNGGYDLTDVQIMRCVFTLNDEDNNEIPNDFDREALLSVLEG